MKRLLIFLVIFFLGCTLTPSKKFETVESRNAKLYAEIARQSSGLKKNETDCYKIYEAQAEACGYSMTYRCRKIRRDMRRIGKVRRCDTTSNRDNIESIMRSLGRGR